MQKAQAGLIIMWLFLTAHSLIELDPGVGEGEQGTLFDWDANWKLLPDHSGACLGDFSLKQGMTPLSQA